MIFLDPPLDPIQSYFTNFESLSKTEKWDTILSQGQLALQEARRAKKLPEEAKICAQLTSTTFYQGNYSEALIYAQRCRELSGEFSDPTLFIRALYLESAVHRAQAAKSADPQKTYHLAVKTAEEALQLYTTKSVRNDNLKGKVYFNLGAAHADNPSGNLHEATRCYLIARECFRDNCPEDVIRTSIRLGKVYLLTKEYDASQKIIAEVRSKPTSERLAMHTDYLEAQLLLALNHFETALKIAGIGLARAKTLGAKEDEQRLLTLIEGIRIKNIQPG